MCVEYYIVRSFTSRVDEVIVTYNCSSVQLSLPLDALVRLFRLDLTSNRKELVDIFEHKLCKEDWHI